MTTFVKLPPPRQLTQSESLDSLDHWKSIFRNYFRRDSTFKQFLDTTCTWDPAAANYGLEAKDGMTAEERKDALVDFLNNLAGFLPHSYLTSKLQENTTSLKECWRIIDEHYNVQITSETLLDFESIKKEPAENYRQFFERLLQHAKLHLAPDGATVDNIKNTVDDKMSISIMNFVALQWLRKSNSQLIQIIKTEYATELRSGQQLAALVPRIAPNIDSLLARYSSANVSKVSTDTTEALGETNIDNTANVRRVDNRGRGRGGGRHFRGGGRGGFANQGNNSQLFCAGCFSLGKQLNMFVNFKHKPTDCTRQGAVSRLLQADGEEYPEEDADEDFYDDGKTKSYEDNPTTIMKLQNYRMPAKPEKSSQQVANIP